MSWFKCHAKDCSRPATSSVSKQTPAVDFVTVTRYYCRDHLYEVTMDLQLEKTDKEMGKIGGTRKSLGTGNTQKHVASSQANQTCEGKE